MPNDTSAIAITSTPAVLTTDTTAPVMTKADIDAALLLSADPESVRIPELQVVKTLIDEFEKTGDLGFVRQAEVLLRQALNDAAR